MGPATVQSSVVIRSGSSAVAARSARVALHCPTVCSTCNFRELCLPCGLRNTDIAEMDGLIYSRERVKRGEHVYRAGDPFKSLFAFRSGFYKSYVISEDGRVQVTGFQMAGDIMGLDGIECDRHIQGVVALDDGEVCTIPYARLMDLACRVPELQRAVQRMMGREIVREQGLMLLLGSMRAEARVATFLLNLSQRFSERGYSSTEFNLRMTRDEIGSYLGLKLETVSRILSAMQRRGLIEILQRYVRILDHVGLRELLGQDLRLQ